MKMICPHCGVKGSAEDSLLGRKVKCPKCTGIFEVKAEVIEAIEVDDLELEQLEDSVDQDHDLTSEKEIDEVFSNLLAGGSGDISAEDTKEGAGTALGDADTDEDEEDIIAALSDFQDETTTENEKTVEEPQDETLTVIEDFPENVIEESGGVVVDESGDEEDIPSALDGVDDGQQHEDTVVEAEPSEENEEALDFDDDIFADEEKGDQQEIPLEEEPEGTEVVADELTDDETAGHIRIDDDEEIPGKDIDAPAEPAEEEEGKGDRDEMADESDIVLEASFLDDNLDEQLEEDDEDDEEMPNIQKCSACDQYVDPEHKYEHSGNVYCSKCVPEGVEIDKGDEDFTQDGENAFPGLLAAEEKISEEAETAEIDPVPGRFTISTLIKDAWHYSKGVKGSIWAGITVMHILLIGIAVAVAAAVINLQLLTGAEPLIVTLVEGGVQAVFSLLSFIFSAGILMIAVNRVGQHHFSWKMVFSGFKRLGSMLLLAILQTIMLIVGFCLFILPGIYLSVGYILAVPLIFVKGLSPWQALETSRLAVHKRWWTVFFALIAMSIIAFLSAIPMGLGLIWTVPMFTVMIGVLYYHCFGADEEEEEFGENPLAQ